MAIDEAVHRLHDRLPLKGRQRQLDKELLQIHKAILRSFVERGYPLRKKEIAGMLSDTDVTKALVRLCEDDLLILDTQSEEPIGAYPMTMENTPHRLIVNGHEIHAMCALDALAVSPMFGIETQIDSHCHISGEPIYLRQKEMEILEAKPSLDVHVGIRWQTPTTCAAHSLCLEMIFLGDRDRMKEWQGSEMESREVFVLHEAVEFAAAFFVPLMEE
ncbi:MAG: hypothetical protein HOC74_15345 [Gemmatimonadetes bacterium]|jgi:hypothetical protein|nr:hypothetical protein [Gemmatimonadota bacterium]